MSTAAGSKVLPLRRLVAVRRSLARQRSVVVFTNGTFDILHRGHVEYLSAARRAGDVLIVGLNSDASIRRIKGPRRPINPVRDRAAVLAALACVDYICVFGDDTPLRLITALVPDVLVKGADWQHDAIVGHDIVERHGGRVLRIRLTPGRSTTGIIERVLRNYTQGRRRPPHRS